MADGFTIKVTGGRELKRQLARLEKVTAGRILENAVVAGALPIVNQAKVNVHKVTATLARSLHIGSHTDRTPDFRTGEAYADIGGADVRHDHAEVLVGTDVAYGRREELGFIGADALGRRYNFTGHPYLRPAFDEKKDEAVRETGEAVKDQLRKVVRG